MSYHIQLSSINKQITFHFIQKELKNTAQDTTFSKRKIQGWKKQVFHRSSVIKIQLVIPHLTHELEN